jgi:hypothetical protein
VPQANDAELTDLYTSSTGFDVEDNEPNTPAPGGAPAADFELQLEAVAGNALGNSGADYDLSITCIDDTLAAPNAGMSPGTIGQQFKAADGWAAGGAAGNFLKKQAFPIAVPAGVRGHEFHYVVSLVSANSDVVSSRESNRFILV